MFTNGKWKAGDSGEHDVPCVDAYREDGSIVELCAVFGTDYVFERNDEAVANARLFAASKEMYELLRVGYPGLRYLAGLSGDDEVGRAWMPWLCDVSDVLKKIEGVPDEARHPD